MTKESAMIKLRIISLPVLLFFLLCGCASTLPSQKVSQDNDGVLSKKSITATSATTEKSNNPNQAVRRVLPAVNRKIAKNSYPITKMQPIIDEALDLCQTAQDLWQKGEFENALEALDQAYSLILQVDAYNQPEFIQQKEDLRFMISKRILEIYASRHVVVNGTHKAIQMVMNKHVQAEIDLFTTGREKSFFMKSYKRSGKYRPYMVAELKKAGLPVELSWLPLIESGFKVTAFSSARALGLWQFIPSTGYKFGLKRTMYIDERIDPVKATAAAIAYLKELHQIFGDWSTALAAYNCGEGEVLRIIRNQNINYLDNFWDLYERLPRETSRFVPRFLAVLHIVNNKEKYGLDANCVYPPFEYETVTISKQVHLNNIAQKTGIPEKILQDLNPELRYKILPNDKYTLRVPPETGAGLLAKLDEISVSSLPTSSPPRQAWSSPSRQAFAMHRVKHGETLSTIAERYHTSVQRIVLANNIRKSNCIVAGKTLKIPLKGTVISTPGSVKPSTHVVKSGDSLWIVARRYGTTTTKIQEINKLPTTNLYIGQILKIPGNKAESHPINGLRIYHVKSGDSPFMIAKKHNMLLGHFLSINQLMPKSKIYPGQRLYVE